MHPIPSGDSGFHRIRAAMNVGACQQCGGCVSGENSLPELDLREVAMKHCNVFPPSQTRPRQAPFEGALLWSQTAFSPANAGKRGD